MFLAFFSSVFCAPLPPFLILFSLHRSQMKFIQLFHNLYMLITVFLLIIPFYGTLQLCFRNANVFIITQSFIVVHPNITTVCCNGIYSCMCICRWTVLCDIKYIYSSARAIAHIIAMPISCSEMSLLWWISHFQLHTDAWNLFVHSICVSLTITCTCLPSLYIETLLKML